MDAISGQSPKRFSIHNGPVGSGKSLVYMAAALATGKRVAVLTESKSLQDQLRDDFGCVGLFDMRGLQNYTCRALAEGGEFEKLWIKYWGRPTCDVGPCTSGLHCGLKVGGCDYFDEYRTACTAQIVSTNYAYWIAIHKFGQGLGKFDVLVCDESHTIDSQISSALSVELTPKDIKELRSSPPKLSAPLQNWRMWGRVQLARIRGKLDFFANGARVGRTVDDNGVLTLVQDTDLPDAAELRFWKRLESKCAALSESDDSWIVETDAASGNIRLAPAWVYKYAESSVFLGIPKIILMSATVRPKTADLLGIPEQQREFFEYPSTFPVERRPIYWLPTVRLSHKSHDDDLQTWAVRVDQILSRRLDRKGIIHTVSFERQQFLLNRSRFRRIMLANTSENTRKVVKEFRDAEAPRVLVSPSVGTGFDFPFESCRYQIIGKIPFKDPRGAIVKMQRKEDPDYLNYQTAQDLIQLYGRSNRDENDFSETFILDDHIEWFVEKYTYFFPSYFLDAFEKIDSVPNPPPLAQIWNKDTQAGSTDLKC